MTDTGGRPVRADAHRNRQRLVDGARRSFAASGEKVTLEAVAREAGVGIGTLYRHFPTREALVEAVYRAELSQLCASAAELLADLSPEVALRTWMDRFADYVSAKRDMAETLRAVVASGAISMAQARVELAAAVRTMLDAGARDGTLRDEVAALDVVVGVVGIFLACGQADQREQAGRLLDLLLDGLRRHESG